MLLLCNDQKHPGNCALLYLLCQRKPGYLVVLVSLGFSNSKSKLPPFINHERSADELANLFCEYLSIELSIKVQSETSKRQFQ